jgi:hypothetical protein
MRAKLTVTLGMILALCAVASLSFAGDYHSGLSLVCSDCHTMHSSQAHGYNPDGTGFSVTPGSSGPYHYLLRNDINELCLSCHNGSAFAPDVFEAHGNGYVRQAGALNDESSAGPYYPTTGHTLNSTDTAPGGSFANADGLNCVNCHAAHGGGLGGPSYRNLGGFGTAVGNATAISYTRGDVDGANPLSAWVHEEISSGTSASHYGVGAITFNEPVITSSKYGDFCKGCHTDFHGAVGGPEIGGTGVPAEEFVRHPTNGVDIGAIGGGHSTLTTLTGRVNQVQVMSPTGQKAGSYDGVDTGLTPSCMSCHKGHGNQNAFGLIYMAGTGTIDEEGDDGTGARNTCKQCHGQGG